jgi:tetratricopeptide (TPR) repeat protein
VAARLRARNPRVSVGLADLVARCLAPAAPDRYPGAAALADDLRRHLSHQPLRGVANRDLGERWRKWRRRRPFALALLGLALVTAAAAGLAAWHVLNQLGKAREALREGQEQLGKRHFSAARGAFRRGLALAEDLPFGRDLARDLADGARQAERGELADALHQAAEHARSLYGAETLSPESLRAAEALCGGFWQRREQILALREADAQVRTDLLELAVFRTDLGVRLAPAAGRARARRQALDLLGEAERLLGPSPVLAHERRQHAAALGLAAPDPGAAPRPATAWEHYALGCSHLRAGDLAAAEAELDRALALAPQHLWANFYKGRCAYRAGRADDALLAFSACVALAPDSAACAFNRGLAHEALGHADRARADYDRALKHDPGLAPAALRRGLLHLAAGRHDAARADLRHALERGADPAEAHYALALVSLARQDPAAAGDHLRQALQHRPDHPQARELQESLRRGN